MVNAYGGFLTDVQRLHSNIALKRCALEAMVKTKEQETLAQCHVRVGTMGALSTPTSLKQMQVMPGSRCFALIGTDEISIFFGGNILSCSFRFDKNN